jgi:hypothetical protein
MAGINLEYEEGRGGKRENEPGANQRGGELSIICVGLRHNNFSLCCYCNSVTPLVSLSVSFSRLSLSSFPSWARSRPCTLCQWGSARFS